MGLASALSTALTGLTASETTIDVVGNNLANSNTVGFKASQATFATQFLQTQSLGSSPTIGGGGTNPRQVGLGTMVADITPNFNQGTIEISSNPLDLAVQGDGFFVVEGSAGEELYTRNGIFKMNADNEMITITGNRVLGFGVDDQFEIQRTTLEPIEIPLGSAAVAQASQNVYLEGTLSPTGDLADTAGRIQTDILGNGSYTAPATELTTSLSQAPNLTAAGTLGVANSLGGALMTGVDGDFIYRFVFSDQAKGTIGSTESMISADLTVAVTAATDDQVQFTNLPTYGGLEGDLPYVRIYRTLSGDPSTFYYVGEQDTSGGVTSFTDTVDDATLALPSNDLLNSDTLTGNYSYYVTFYNAGGEESHPNPVESQNVGNSRVLLTDLPEPAAGDASWTGRRIYRNLATDEAEFRLLVDSLPISNGANGISYIDSIQDATLAAVAQELDFDGPKITVNTLLTDVIRRDGSTYSSVFSDTGTLQFTGRKGGRSQAVKELTIEATSTVGDLTTFMEDAMGIQERPGPDPTGVIPKSEVPPAGVPVDPGGVVSLDGRIVLTGNNGVDNELDIGLSGMLLITDTGTDNVNMPWGTLQSATGESAVTDFLAYDSLGIPIRVRMTAVLESRDSTSTTYRWFADSPDNDPAIGSDISVGTGLITFDGEGNFVSSTESTVSIERRNVSSASPLEFDLDFSQLSGLATDQSSLAVSRQDGSGAGTLTSFIVGEDGTIRGVFSNGITRDLAQLQLVRFANAAGLEQKGENLYAAGINSGLPVQGDPGSQGIGSVVAGAVELSNTDIGSNLIDLILASTMYRGNTRVITTAQEMIDELLSLRR